MILSSLLSSLQGSGSVKFERGSFTATERVASSFTLPFVPDILVIWCTDNNNWALIGMWTPELGRLGVVYGGGSFTMKATLSGLNMTLEGHARITNSVYWYAFKFNDSK